MLKQADWKNQRVLITGGTSGLGKALAINLDKQGAQVVIVARHQDNLDELKKGSNIKTIQGDISKQQDIYRISGEAIAVLGGIDVLFNNASYLGATPLKLLLDTECEDFEKVLGTNVLGPFRLTKAILPSMILQNQGTVINISSDAAMSAYPHWGSYSVSKAAIDHLSRIWSEELSPKNIRFLSIDPGDMNTPMHLAAIPDAEISELYNPIEVANDLLTFISEKQSFTQIRYSSQEWRKQAAA